MVEAQPGVSFDAIALRAAVGERIEPYGIPSEFRVIPAMPRNINDKLDREAVSRWYAAPRASAS